MFGEKIKGVFSTIINAPQEGINYLKGLQLDIYENLGSVGSEAGDSAKNFYAGEAGNKAGVWVANNWQKLAFGVVVAIVLVAVGRGK